MKHLRVLPLGCPVCRSTAFSYDWSRVSNYWRVPLTIAFFLIPLPVGTVYLRCDACGLGFSSRATTEAVH